MVGHFKQHFEHFKHTNTHFHILFHSQVYQKHPNNITQTPIPNNHFLARVFQFLEGKNKEEKKESVNKVILKEGIVSQTHTLMHNVLQS